MKLTNKDRLDIHKNIWIKLEYIIDKQERLKEVNEKISKAKPVELKLIPTYEFDGADLIAEMNYLNNIIRKHIEQIKKMYDILYNDKF